MTVASRLISAGAVARAQVDFYAPPTSSVREAGILPATLSLSTFFNNSPIMWPLRDGTTVVDSSVVAGIVYFNEIVGAPGFYSVRFFPDKIGFWRLSVNNPSLGVECNLEFDAVAPNAFQHTPGNAGLVASFI